MIKQGVKDVKEREITETNYAYEDYPTARTDMSSVSDDLYNNYAQRGTRFEESISNENFEQATRYESDNVDASPSQTTMQYLYVNEDFEEDEAQDTRKSYKISPRGKIMITVYALVVATIIALIAMNARVLRSMEESIEETQGAVESLIKHTQMLGEELEYVSSEKVISQKAIELGMSK